MWSLHGPFIRALAWYGLKFRGYAFKGSTMHVPWPWTELRLHRFIFYQLLCFLGVPTRTLHRPFISFSIWDLQSLIIKVMDMKSTLWSVLPVGHSTHTPTLTSTSLNSNERKELLVGRGVCARDPKKWKVFDQLNWSIMVRNLTDLTIFSLTSSIKGSLGRLRRESVYRET